MHQTSMCHLKMRDNENHLYCNQGLSLFSTLDDMGEKKPSASICKMRYDERKGMFFIYQKQIKMALSLGTCWSETNCH